MRTLLALTVGLWLSLPAMAEEYLPEKSNIIMAQAEPEEVVLVKRSVTQSYFEDPVFLIAVLTFLTVFGNVLISFRAKSQVDKVEIMINSHMTELLDKTREIAHAAGIAEQKDRNQEP